MLLYHFGYGTHGPARAGKRLRPQMVMRVAEALGAESGATLDASAAVEMLHNYSLIHDDIEDRDELRRGRRTLWAVYGVPQAINAGDALCAMTFLTLLQAETSHPYERVVAMVRTLHEAHRVMCVGQSRDIAFESASHVAIQDYHEMIAGKTAALFAASCALGAECAHAPADAVQLYAAAGHAFGISFQVQDDILGIWASSDATGKTVGNDLARRKWTYPVAWALSQPSSPARTVVADAYAPGHELDTATVGRVIEALDSLGAKEAATRAAREPLARIERLPNADVRDFLLEGSTVS
jgi:geranylgeranyl diphosphate synthase type I